MKLRYNCALLLVLITLGSFAEARIEFVQLPELQVTAMELVGRERISRTEFEYQYRVTFLNNGPAILDVEATPGTFSSAVTPLNSLQLGDMPNATSVTATQLLLVRVQRRVRYDPNAVAWFYSFDGVPDIVVESTEHEFGDIPATCPIEQTVRVENLGNGDLFVDSITLEPIGIPGIGFNLDLSIEPGSQPPWRLPAGEFREGVLTYAPINLGPEFATITIESSDPDSPTLEIALSGEGIAAGFASDTFVQTSTTNSLVDVMMHVDKSSSMVAKLEAVQNNALQFAQELGDSGADYRFAIAANDDGCVTADPIYVDSSTDPILAQQTIVDMISIATLLDGFDTERGFKIAEAALLNASPSEGTCNAGLLREDARLEIVFVSDEPEQSAEAWYAYLDRFEALKPDPTMVTLHAVAGDYPAGCDGIENSDQYTGAEPGAGYYEAVAQSGGYFLSICTDDWPRELGRLAEAVAIGLKASFPLSEKALESTIRVWVDGEELLTGWALSPGSVFTANTPEPLPDTLVFDSESIPPENSTIVVDYAVRADCDD